MGTAVKQDFLADIRQSARAHLGDRRTTDGFAAVILRLVAGAIKQRTQERRESFERVTALRLALREAVDALDAAAGRYDTNGNDLEPIADGLRRALEQDSAATEPAPKQHNCRTDGCDLGHDTPPLAGPEKPPRCRLDREYAG